MVEIRTSDIEDLQPGTVNTEHEADVLEKSVDAARRSLNVGSAAVDTAFDQLSTAPNWKDSEVVLGDLAGPEGEVLVTDLAPQATVPTSTVKKPFDLDPVKRDIQRAADAGLEDYHNRSSAAKL